MRLLIATLSFALLTGEASSQQTSDPNKSVTLTVGDLDAIINAAVSQARAHDDSQKAAAAIAKYNAQVAPPQPPKPD